jgi:hypothetical protein
MISLLKPDQTCNVLGRGTVFIFDTRTQPMCEKIKRGDHFRCAGKTYQAMGIERATFLTSPPTVSPEIGIVAREIT